jgi:hypothetical protein
MRRGLNPLLLIALLLPFTAKAELSLGQLADQCGGLEPQPSQPAIGVLMCVSYLGGALDQIILADGLAVHAGSQSMRTICGPEQGKLEKLADLVKRASKTAPELRDKSARAVLRGIILQEYKCS